MSLLEAKDIESGYGKISILHEISIKVEEKEVVTIIGPNGAGKTTFMRTLFGLLKPRRGKILFQDEEIGSLGPDEVVQKGIGYVLQENNVFPSLTVMENLKMGAYLLGSFDDQLDDVFKRFPILEERQNQKAVTLSGGERQMLAIASSLMLSPRLLLLDEPCGGLAPQIVNSVCEKILEINEMGTAILWVVEQNPKQVMRHARRSYVLESGTIKFEGTPDDLLQERKFESLFFGEGK